MKRLERRSETPDSLELDIDGRPVRIAVRRSARARRYTLSLKAAQGGFVLVVPARGTLERGAAFARANAGWIRARLARLPGAVPFAEGAVIPLRGVDHVVRSAGTRRGTVWTQGGGDMPAIRVAGDAAHLARRLTDWLKAEAKHDLEAAATRHARTLGVGFRRISVRDQTSRWGSCSASGTLSFSWRLVLAPPMVLDYLAAHEVAHLVEMNHGPAFWRTVRRAAPDTDAAEAWLKRHGASLHGYGRA